MKVYFIYARVSDVYEFPMIEEEDCVERDEYFYYFYAYTPNKKYKKLFFRTRDTDIFSFVTHNMTKEDYLKLCSHESQKRLDIYHFPGSSFTDQFLCPHLCTNKEASVIFDEADLMAENLINERLDSNDFDILLELEEGMKPKYRETIFSDTFGIGAIMHYRTYPDDGTARDAYLNVVYNEEIVYEMMFENTYRAGGIEDEMLEILSKATEKR